LQCTTALAGNCVGVKKMMISFQQNSHIEDMHLA
jgi:hypothetical protein